MALLLPHGMPPNGPIIAPWYVLLNGPIAAIGKSQKLLPKPELPPARIGLAASYQQLLPRKVTDRTLLVALIYG